MEKWNLIVDVAKCTNCNMCTLACQDEYVGNDFPGYAAEMPKHGHHWIDIRRKERGSIPMIDVAYLPVMCQHCDEAPCIAAAEGGAVSKRGDGIVIIDPAKAKGQKQLVESCPYGAIWWNEETDLPQHWIFDAHLLDDGWKEPRAAQVCATAAITAQKCEDAVMQKRIADEGLENFHPEHGTKPRVWYKNLHRFEKCFIGGTLAEEKDGVVDCVEGAKVTLFKGSDRVADTTSDNYGDFKFDHLDENSGAHRVDIEAAGTTKSLDVELGLSVNLGEIMV